LSPAYLLIATFIRVLAKQSIFRAIDHCMHFIEVRL